ncbi:MAG: NAD(P)-dependent alcohol dehydrogenase [Polyangiaceae bacterium]
MRAIAIEGAFGLEHLRLHDRPDPTPGPGQVVVRVRSTSLNARDLMMVRGTYNPRQPLPLIPLSDGVGTIEAVGEGVTRVNVGDRVASLFAQGWLSGAPSKAKFSTTLGSPRDGMLTELALLDAEGVVRVPEYLSDDEGATLPCAALTAWSALITQGQLVAGQTVLVQGTGGVSIFALQIAKLVGARVIVTSSSDEKLERATALGADATINYKTNPDWEKRARDLTGDGVDHIVEVGGAGTLTKSLKAVKVGGTISIIGVLAGASTELSVVPVLMQNLRLQGVFVGHRESFEAMNRAFALAKIKPVIDRVFQLEDARAAFEHMASGTHFGKICVRVGG